jgi:predicted NAD-dependent protein-ADP-ribosyltransferase YbiA (DUF1768 family)
MLPTDTVTTSGIFAPEYPSSFTLGGLRYRSFEQFLLAEKAPSEETLEEILVEKSDWSRFRNFEWTGDEYHLYVVGNLAKFSQNQELGEGLVNTGSAILVDNSAGNLLGRALMEVRGLVREVDEIESFGNEPAERE